MKNDKLLIFPPHWSTTHPYLSLPCLTSFLRENNINITAEDLNIKCFYHFLSESFLDNCKSRILNKELKSEIKEKYLMLFEFLITNMPIVKDTFNNIDTFINLQKYIFTKTYIDEFYNFISVAYSPLCLGRTILDFGKTITIENLNKLLDNDAINPYIQFYKDILKNYEVENLKFIAISLSGISQIVPTITLCKIIKQINKNVHITIGGNTFSKVFDKINVLKDLFVYFDSILVFEGETPLLKLIKALDNNLSFEDIPNLIYKDGDNIKINNVFKSNLNLNNMPVPDFTDFDFKLYSSPKVILPYYTSRSCYWGKCAFCDHDFGYDGNYRVKSVDKVIDDIKVLINKYNAEYIHFIDEALPSRFIDQICERIIDENINVKWFTCVKAEKNFTLDLCAKMHRAGCTFVSLGVESCSSKILNDMCKGITIEDIEITLTNFKSVGIWAHSFMINNFPTETYKDKLDTLVFVMKHKKIFTSIGLSEFTLSKNAKINDNKSYYGILDTNERTELSNDVDYTKFKEIDSKIYSDLLEAYKFNTTNTFFMQLIMEREHLTVILGERNYIEDIDNLYLDIKNAINLNCDFLLWHEEKDKLIVYNLINKKLFNISKDFINIINVLKDNSCLSEVKKYLYEKNTPPETIYQIINFIKNKLFYSDII